MVGAIEQVRCPVCDAVDPVPVLHRAGVPVHQNLLYDTPAAATAARRGVLDVRVCSTCGFTFNAAFDPALLEYGPAYENTQTHSPAFAAHLGEMAGRVLAHEEARTGTVVEVGCGKGDFLLRLLAHPDSRGTGVGFDPSYLGPDELLNGRARFVRAFYGPDAADHPADAVVCRHVIEHIPDPLDLLRAIRAASADGRTRVFFETPCADWIFRRRVLWDLFYEHCSVFTAASLRLALSLAGFRVTGVQHVFGGQYLWAEAVAAEPTRPPVEADTARLARGFADRERTRVARWRHLLDDLHRGGPVLVWGAGAKGLTFCNLTDPAAARVAAVVDVNPAKQGRFLGGTGHPIVPPATAAGAAAAVVLNPNYVPEIEAALLAAGPTTARRPRVVDLMTWEADDAAGR